MAHAQKSDFVFRRNGRVHLNRRRRQLSRLQAADVCAPAVVMLDTPCSEVAWECWLPAPFASFPFTSPPVRGRCAIRFQLESAVPECRTMCSMDGELLGPAVKCPGGGLAVGSFAHAWCSLMSQSNSNRLFFLYIYVYLYLLLNSEF